jgi:ABC-type polysaccharide/polyol phosphate export systems, permease component
MIQDFKELYDYREMLKSLVRKELRTRYKGSFLGFFWTFINPLMQLGVYSLVFPYIMRVRVPHYPMFVFVALLPWIFFSTALLNSTPVVINNKDLVKKVYFPRELLPISATTTALMNLIFGFIIVIPCLLISGIPITFSVLYLPLIIMAEYIVALGFSLLLSCLNVYFRDLEHMLGIFTMLWFYLTPIIYTVDMVPANYRTLYFLNPMTTIILSFKDVLYYGKAPDLSHLGLVTLFGVILFIIGYKLFRVLQKDFAEEI